MKNFLWFMHKPADEREEALFNTAYRNSLSSIWIGISFILIGSYYMNELMFNASLISIIALVLLVVSYLSGWILLRNEDLSFHKEGMSKLPQAWLLLLFIMMIGSLALIMIYFFPEKYFSIFIASIITIQLLLIIWAWKSSAYISTHIRLIVSILIPTFSVPFAYYREKSFLKRACIGLGFSTLISFFVFSGIFSVRAFIVEPILISTGAFEPELKKDQFILVDKRDIQYKPDDYIIFNKEGGVTVAKIISIKNEEVLARTSMGESKIDLGAIAGKILKNRDDIPNSN